MKWSVEELTDVRELVEELLDGIGLQSYVYNIEQKEDDWIVSVDYPHRDEWRTVDLCVDKKALGDCFKYYDARSNLSSAWRNRLEGLR